MSLSGVAAGCKSEDGGSDGADAGMEAGRGSEDKAGSGGKAGSDTGGKGGSSGSVAAGGSGGMPAPVVLDPSCPMLEALNMVAAGCCIEGMCGLDLRGLGGGCVELGAVAEGAAMKGLMLDVPSPRPCGGGEVDGGVDDDGGI